MLRETNPQVVYLNSLFDFRFAILPLLTAWISSRGIPVMLAPRGELSVGALSLKRRKKLLFIALFRMLGLHQAVSWHASTSLEKADIERVFGRGIRIYTALELRIGISIQSENHDYLPPRDPYACSLVFFSRIVPKKNVATVIKAMSMVPKNTRLSIAGPIEDARYWGQCRALMDEIGDPESVRYVGIIPADSAVRFLADFDLFVLPTLGENFGHVILESLAAGTPVIVGYDTPWHQIEAAGAGWMCNPTNPEEIAELIRRFLALDERARWHMRTAARGVANEILNDPRHAEANRAMFRALISGEHA